MRLPVLQRLCIVDTTKQMLLNVTQCFKAAFSHRMNGSLFRKDRHVNRDAQRSGGDTDEPTTAIKLALEQSAIVAVLIQWRREPLD
jgi:hypothetical protein